MRTAKRCAGLFLILLTLLAFAAPVRAMTCEFDTPWGLLTLYWNQATGAVSGNYPHKGGTVQGTRYNDGSVQGMWSQVDAMGEFYWMMNNHGFTGNWKYSSDRNWRGAWNGSLRRCY